MPARKVKIKIRTGKIREPRRRLFQPRRFFRRWGYFLLMATACIVTVVVLWIMVGRIKPILPSD